ncbi:MAG: translation initiation factor IF-2 [SAR324 cluster bacterium]|nr:translation initiation factor IF-2 [SAR324 cluster bacterium]
MFELARELNMPSKQLIQKMIGFGIVAESNFKGLSEEEIAFVKARLTEAAGQSAPSSDSLRKRKVLRRTSDETQTSSAEEGTAEKRPRRIRKKGKAQEEVHAETVEEKVVEELPPSSELPAEDEKAVEVEEKAEKVSPPEEKVDLEEAKPKVETPKSQPGIEKEAEKAKLPVVEKQESKKQATEFEKFEETKPVGEKPKRGKKAPREFDEPFNDPLFKKPKKPQGSLPPDEEGDTWEQRSRRKRNRRNRHKVKVQEKKKHIFNPRQKSIKIGSSITVGELAGQIGIKVSDIIKKLMGLGVMASINQAISGENAALIAAEFNIEVELVSTIKDIIPEPDQGEQVARAPIVTIMGHVDHGKTSLLDKIRATQVTEGEAGGITQHIGAYRVITEGGDITFLDTPGHEAFTAMRARGANVTDIVILVVAANDGVQPQTVEAIHHAQAAEVPIIVVINKIDLPEANPNRVQQELLEHALVSEDFGGDTIFVHASAKTGEGLDTLLEMIHLQAEVLELKATVEGKVRGVIIESQISRGRGPVGTVLIQQGTLKVGDYYVVGETFGKVRALFNDKGQAIEKATPATPAEVLGFNSVPITGEQFIVLDDEKTARQIAQSRAYKTKDAVAVEQQKTHLENLFNRISSEENVELNILVRGDVHGSVEALQESLAQLGNELVSVRFLHTGTGTITENDVMLASASDAIIIGFNTTLDANAKIINARENVDIRLYTIIYDAINDVKNALEGLLKPTLRDEVIGRCEVRQIFNASRTGQILGCYVTEGKLLRDALVRIFRQEDVIHEGGLVSLKRFKDDVREVQNNYECGIVVNTDEVMIGDIIEAYIQVEESARL